MRIVMINDCAYVGETLTEYFPEEVQTTHLRRSRGLLDKTYRTVLRIRKAEGDLYHCHYLLQDCWLALKFHKRPILGHAHGTDVRESIKHPVWGRMIKHNLKKCNKIIVSTPNLLEKAIEFNENSEYIPNPVNRKIFHPETKPHTTEPIATKWRVLIASACDWRVRGTDKIIRALKMIREPIKVKLIEAGGDYFKTIALANSLDLKLDLLPPVPHSEMPKYYWDADIIVASIGIGGTLGMTALEAIACGKPVITNVSSTYPVYDTFPIHDVSTSEQIAETILSSRDGRLWQAENDYLESFHNPEVITGRFVRIYDDLIGEKSDD
jgi:glycosyltransferase involved in cell wall biosynthesis